MFLIHLIYHNNFHVSMNLLASDGGMCGMQMHTHESMCRQLWTCPCTGKLHHSITIAILLYQNSYTVRVLFLEKKITFSS